MKYYQIFITDDVRNLKIAIHNPIDLKIIVIISEWINQLLGHLQPAHVEEELQSSEDWEVHIDHILIAILSSFVLDPLLSDHRGDKIAVNR